MESDITDTNIDMELTSMLYLSLASCLRRRVGMQGMMQPRRQHRMPGFSRPCNTGA